MKIALWIFITFPILLCAHPHVFIDADVSVGKDKIGIVWKFDEMTSNLMLLDYDKNKNHKLEKDEIASLYKTHFTLLREYSWFTTIYSGNKEAPVLKIGDFNAFMDKKRVIYTFTVPKPSTKHYEIRLYDPENYVAIEVVKSSLRCVKGIRCQLEDFDDDYGYGYKVNVNE